MPSLTAALPSTSDKAYAPLADETNHLSGKGASTSVSSRNGTIIYAKRMLSSSSSGSGGSEEVDVGGAGLRSGSEETLSPPERSRIKGKGKSKEVLSGYGAVQGYGRDANHEVGGGGSGWQGDVGLRRRDSASGSGTGLPDLKGKQRAWDVEQGRTNDEAEERDSESSYPPVNEEEEEFNRIQDNLARLHAQDQARRRARQSRMVQAPPADASPGTSTSFLRRPLSLLSTFSAKGSAGSRNSLMGIAEEIRNDAKPTVVTHEGWVNGGIPLQASPISASSSRIAENPFLNPYERQPPMSPTRQPTSPTSASPFIDPATPRAAATALPPPMSPEDASFDYAGPAWIGGAVRPGSPEQDRAVAARVLPEKWWKALCAWGDDLDGGHDEQAGNQAGRTNPFE